jgi:predicted DNA-binding ribbon-helix-helix protein
MKSSVVMRPVRIAGHKTSVSLEDAFWTALKAIAAAGKTTVSDLVGAIDVGRQHANLSSAIRLFILDFYKAKLGREIDARQQAAGIKPAREVADGFYASPCTTRPPGQPVVRRNISRRGQSPARPRPKKSLAPTAVPPQA